MAEIAKIVQGNNFNIAVPLKVYILNEGEVLLQNYTPAEGDDVTIRLVGERRGYTYKPTTEGNVAHLQLSGHEVCDTYAVEVVIIGADGTMLRSYRGDQLAIVYNVDTIIADGAVQEGELCLDSQFFIQGEQGIPGQDGQDGQDGADGRGIVSITKTATAGLVDTYTITYTDGTTSTFEVTNGKDGSGGGEDFIVNVTYSGGAYTADKTPQECCMAFLDGQRVVFVNTASTPLYGDSRTFIATSVSVYNQYGQWNIYAVSGYGRGDAKVDILCYERQYTTSLTFKSITATTIIDNTTSTSTTAALSANQGKVLKGLVDGKANTADLAAVATSGNYNDLTNKPSIPAAQVNADWDAASGVAQILNKPTIPDLSTYCPIIEDTRQSAVAAITGVAPFASLVDGQRIVLHFKYRNEASPTLQLTLSGGTTTAAIPLYQNYNSGVGTLTVQAMPAGSFGEFVYDATNSRWMLLGKDVNTTYANTSQADINNSAQGSRLIEPKLLRDNFYLKSEVDATFQKHTAIVTVPSGATAPTDGYEPNKMYDFGKVASVNFAAYDTSKEIANAVNLYMCTFQVASGGTTLSLNANIKYPNGDDGTELTNLLTEEDRVFEITIRDNKLSYLYFD